MNFRPGREGADEPRIEITPLVDVVFLLLIFFLLTTTFATQPSLDVELPRSSEQARQPTRPDELVLQVTRDGRVLHEGRTLEPEALGELMTRTAGDDPDTTVLLRADRRVPHGDVVQVMDLARRTGLRRVAIATEAQAGP